MGFPFQRCKPSLKMVTLHLVPPDLLSRANRAGYQAASISVPSTRSSRRRQCFQFLCTCNLWIGAERPGPFRLAIPNPHRHNLFRRFFRFDPFSDCLDRIKGVRAIAPAAMVHPGNHEEAVEDPYPGPAPRKIANAA